MNVLQYSMEKELYEIEKSKEVIESKSYINVIVIDSGFGGLSVCGELEKIAKDTLSSPGLKIEYINCAFSDSLGYNNLKSVHDKITIFNDTLERTRSLNPDIILIACNTLSVLLQFTCFFKMEERAPTVSVLYFGINEGVDAYKEDDETSFIIFGTETTIESNLHKNTLIDNGIPKSKIHAQACSRLQIQIERESDKVIYQSIYNYSRDALIRSELLPTESPFIVILCCTHYGYKKDLFYRAFEELGTAGRLEIICPNKHMASTLRRIAPIHDLSSPRFNISIRSSYTLNKEQIESISNLLSPYQNTLASLKNINTVNDIYNKEILSELSILEHKT